MAELRPRVKELRAAGIELAVVGNGAPNLARGFRERMELPAEVPVLSDESRRAYLALGMKRSLGGLLHPAVFTKGAAAFKAGFRQRGTEGDARQLGGVLLILPDGRVPYHHRSRYAGDHPPIEEVMEAALAQRSA